MMWCYDVAGMVVVVVVMVVVMENEGERRVLVNGEKEGR